MKNFNFLFVCLGLFFVIGCNKKHPKAKFKLTEILEKHTPTLASIRLGNGYNSILQEEAGRAISYDNVITSSGNAKGGSMFAYADIVTSYIDLAKKSDLSISANFKLFGFRGSANANFFKSFKFNSKSQYLYAECYLETPSNELNDYRLKPEAKQVADSNINVFYQRYGDEFVFKEHRGGRFRLVYEFKSSNSTDEEINSHQISLAKKFFNGNFSIDERYKEEYKKIEDNQNMKLYLMKVGGDYDSIPVISFDSLMSYYRGFPTTVKPGSGNEAILSVETKSYRSADNNSSNITSLGGIVDQSTKYIDALNTRLCSLYESYGNVNYLKQNKLDYEKKLADSLINLQSQVESQIQETIDLYNTFVNTLTHEETVDQIRSKTLTFVNIPELSSDEFLPTFNFGNEVENEKIYLGKIVTSKKVNLVLKGRLQFLGNNQAFNVFSFNPTFETAWKNAVGSSHPTSSYVRWFQLFSPKVTPIHIYLHDFYTNKKVLYFTYTDDQSVLIPPGRYMLYVDFDTKGRLIDPAPGSPPAPGVPLWDIQNMPATFYQDDVVRIPRGESITLSFNRP